MSIKDLEQYEKPREKLIHFGAKALFDYELLAIILRTGTKDKSVIDLSKELLRDLNSFAYCQELTIEELMKFKGIGQTKAVELIAIFEFASRVLYQKHQNNKILSAKDCYLYLKSKLENYSQEHFIALYLSSNNEIIYEKTISIGTINKTIANQRDVIRWGLKISAFGVIVAHNHPNGDSQPSTNDILFTKRIFEACQTVDLLFVDHIIIGKNNYYSFKSNKFI